MAAKRKKGHFIVLEGPDKSGKSTQAELLCRSLDDSKKGLWIHTREPGGTGFAEAIRSVLLNPDHVVHPLAELFLYEAARVQHTQERILPALKKGAVVICERYVLATLAYQGFARGLNLPLVEQMNDIATGGLKPDLTILLDIPDSQFQSRDPDRDLDRLEAESASFRRKVAKGYRSLARRKKDIIRINADRDRSVVHTDIVALVSTLLGRPLTPVPFRT